MATIDKIIAKFFKKPIPNDITFEEIETLFTHVGCKIRYGGRHPQVVHAPSGTVIPVPRHKKSVDEAYIKQLKSLLQDILTEENNK